ncbi:integrase [Salmonella enterica]|nr:integrase [Salmonella enterica]
MTYYNIEKRLKSDDEPYYPGTALLKEKSVIITARDLPQKYAVQPGE